VRGSDALNDPEFVRLAVSGDADAFQRLFESLARPLAEFVERQGVPPAHADEVAADALIKLKKSLPTYRDQGAKFTTWIFTIAQNCAIDHLRAAQRRASNDAAYRAEHRRGHKQLPEDKPLNLTASALALATAMDGLGPTDRDILRMREVMEYDEIARVEGVTLEAVRVRHKRAYDRLKQRLATGGSNV
jgi:RNA polymerase sigma-70 factor (ECF subfamily)